MTPRPASHEPVDIVDLLSCVALEPRLGGVLFLDADPKRLVVVAEALARVLTTVENRRHRVVVLNTAHDDETLWAGWRRAQRKSTITVEPRSGILVETDDQPVPVLVVPDLPAAGLPVRRAAVVAAGADVVHVERDAHSLRWHPTARWLAASARSDLYSTSPHLLDRFAVRWVQPLPDDSAEALSARLGERIAAALSTGPGQIPRIGEEALDLLAQINTRPDPLTDQSGMHTNPRSDGVRRHLAAARVARALARRRGSMEVTHVDVESANHILGLRTFELLPSESEGPAGQRPSTPNERFGQAASPETAADQATRAVGPTEGPGRKGIPTGHVEESPAPPQSVNLDLQRYPEDDPHALPQPQSLRPFDRSQRPGPTAGARANGYASAHNLRDLAIVPTLFRATWRRLFRLNDGSLRPLRILPDDLRRMRRAARSDSALVLVLDHTTPHRENWTRALSPHLHWAYETRAAITIIEFGHDGMVDELRPERHRRNSVVDPCVEAALDRRPGRASPLAAAIDLAAEELCRLRMRSQPAVRDVRLIVVTDGRGNVPYAASASGRLNGIVRREGVEDALAVARDRRIFQDVRTTVVTPRLYQYAELPDTLAHALHGLVSIFPPPASDNQR